MHCDDKRTAAALKNNIADGTQELAVLEERLQTESDGPRRARIEERISELRAFVSENAEQLRSVG